MSSLRPESHVAQQIRRDKLRIQNSSQEFPNNLEQLSLLHPGFNLDLLPVRNVIRNANVLDEQAVYSSEMPNFSNPLQRNALEYQELGAADQSGGSRLMMHQYGSFPHNSLSGIHSSSQKEQCNLGNWRSSAQHHQQGCDWIVNYGSSSLAAAELNNVSTYNEVTQIQFSNASGGEIQKQLGVMHHHHHHHPHPHSSSSPLYQNALQDIVKSASISAHGSDMASLMQQTGHGIWVGGDTSEFEPQPSYGNQPNNNPLRFGWTNRTVDSNPQSLSLSLSSNAQSKPCVSQFEDGTDASNDLQSGCGISKDPQCLKYMKSIVKPSIEDTVGLTSKTSYRNVGPLGPFTGYATILKSSRFLKSAQLLLDEFCCLSGSKFGKACDGSERVSQEVSASTSADTVTFNETGVATNNASNSGSSSSMFYVSNENSADMGAGSSSFCLSSRPDYQQKKAKLLYMQEEVTRRFKQYHQQMQMVVSSFESVAGLSSATPYISLALKSISRHFRCLKNSISDQLKLISQVLGEDLSIPTTSTSSKVDTNMERLRCMDHNFQKNKSSRVATGLLEPQQHAWRPQRGLPERSVAILRAWLFEHFLHPYPTDTDKHMLATQTGLSRNQVSNWFINARVRVWKPMVEEIHMLETKTTTGANENSKKNEGTSCTEGSTRQPRVDKPMSKFGMHSIPENQFQVMEMGSSSIATNVEESELNAEQWSQEKRSRLECMNSSMDGTLMGFVPYRRGGIEIGGLGSVSLTLGLRHGHVEGVQQQQQLQEEQLRRHLGGHMINDF